MNNAWALGVLWNFIYRWSAACGCGRLEWLYLPTDCMMSRSIGAAKSGLRWMNMDRATTARQRVSSSYSSRTAAQSRHLQATTGATGHLEQQSRWVTRGQAELRADDASTCQTWWSAARRWIPRAPGQTCWLCWARTAGWSWSDLRRTQGEKEAFGTSG